MRLTIQLLGHALSLSFDRDDTSVSVEDDPPGTLASQVETAGYDYMQDDRAVACFGYGPTKA